MLGGRMREHRQERGRQLAQAERQHSGQAECPSIAGPERQLVAQPECPAIICQPAIGQSQRRRTHTRRPAD
jgi:hypothetical protein